MRPRTKKPVRFSLSALLIFITMVSIYLALVELLGVRPVSIGLVGLCAIVVLGVTYPNLFLRSLNKC